MKESDPPQINKDRFSKQIAILLIGTTGAQLITITLAPIISRLYTPEMLGTLGVYMSIIGILTPIIALTYPTAIALASDDNEAKLIYQLSNCIGTVISLLSLGIVWKYYEQISITTGLPSKSGELYLIALFALISTVYASSSNYLIRKQEFSEIAKVNTIQSALSNGLKIIAGVIAPSHINLLISNISSTLISTLIGIYRKRELLSFSMYFPDTENPIKSLNSVAKKYIDFPLYRSPQVLISALSQGLPVILISALFGASSAGHYSLAFSVLFTPATMIGNSISQVYYQRIAEKIRAQKNTQKDLTKTTLTLFTIGAPPTIILIIFSPTLFEYIFGDKWRYAGEYAQWISLWVFFNFISRPSVSTIPALNAQKGLLKFEVISSTLKLLGLYVGYMHFNDDIASIALFAIAGSTSYLLLIVWTISLSARTYNKETA